jgi:micrococcal nuclease
VIRTPATSLLVAPLLVLVGGCGQSPCAEILSRYQLGDHQTCGPAGALVTRVVDGDTVDLQDGARVRYIGVDTPERGQDYYQEATEFNRTRVEGKRVELVYDQECQDRYGRLLAYVCAGGEMINEALVAACLARTLPIKPNTSHADVFWSIWERASQSCQKVCSSACQ